MKKKNFYLPAAALCIIIFLAGCKTLPSFSRTQKHDYGIWFSYLDYSSLCKDMDETAFSAFTEHAVSNMKSLGITTLYLHAVAFTDALYSSQIYPQSLYTPSSFDSFAIFLNAARAQNIRVEAWINPLRSYKENQVENLPDDFILKQWIINNDGKVGLVNGRWYLNPAYPEVRAIVCSVAQELIAKYNVDGIHIDDYFYPPAVTEEFDAQSYSESLANQNNLTLESFRTNNIDSLIRELHAAIKASSPECTFSISPSGNYEYCRDKQYADPVHWISEGTVDCLIPQIYWGFNHATKPFKPTLAQWSSFTHNTDVKLIAGLAAYKVGLPDTYAGKTAADEWTKSSKILARETKAAIKSGCAGTAYFSYRSLFNPEPEAADAVTKEMNQLTKCLRAR